MRVPVEQLKRFDAGEMRALAQLITMVENRAPETSAIPAVPDPGSKRAGEPAASASATASASRRGRAARVLGLTAVSLPTRRDYQSTSRDRLCTAILRLTLCSALSIAFVSTSSSTASSS